MKRSAAGGMRDPGQRRRCYLTPGHGAFWTWDADRSVVTFASGAPAIALRQELVVVLAALGEHGFPRFDLLVTVLAAATAAGRKELGVELPPVFAAGDPFLKARLVQVLAGERRPELSGSDAEEAWRQLRQLDFAARPAEVLPRAWRLEDARLWLRSRVAALGPDRLEMLVRTGLAAPPTPAPIELPHHARVEALLDQTEHDRNLWTTVARARQLLAVWRPLPGRQRQPAFAPTTPIGLSLRGPLDRLLLPELAQDPDVLLVRLALDQALRTERDDTEPKAHEERLVLVDVGLRALGRPREFAAAVALAAAAAPRPGRLARTRVFAAGPELDEFDLATRAGLVGLLAQLDQGVHPGAQLPKLAALARQAPAGAEVLLVVPQAVAADPEFMRACAVLAPYELLVMVVQRNGRCELFEHRGRSSVRVLAVKLDVQPLQPAKSGTLARRRAQPQPGHPLLVPPPHGALLFRLDGVGTAWIVRRPRTLWFAEHGEHGGRRVEVAVPERILRMLLTRQREVLLVDQRRSELQFWRCPVDDAAVRRASLQRATLAAELQVGWCGDRLLLYRSGEERLRLFDVFGAGGETVVPLDSTLSAVHGDWLYAVDGWRRIELDASGAIAFRMLGTPRLECAARVWRPSLLRHVSRVFGWNDPERGWGLGLRVRQRIHHLAVERGFLVTRHLHGFPYPSGHVPLRRAAAPRRIDTDLSQAGFVRLSDRAGDLPDAVVAVAAGGRCAMWWAPDHYFGESYFLPGPPTDPPQNAGQLLAAYAEALA